MSGRSSAGDRPIRLREPREVGLERFARDFQEKQGLNPGTSSRNFYTLHGTICATTFSEAHDHYREGPGVCPRFIHHQHQGCGRMQAKRCECSLQLSFELTNTGDSRSVGEMYVERNLLR